MAEFKPREFYYHACEARASTEERLSLPLHYYLKRGDVIAFRKALRTGAGAPLLTDEYGKTVLDICLDEIEKILVTGLCTSFPIDDVIASVTCSKFYLEDENEMWEALYQPHERALYQTFKDGSPNIVKPVPDDARQRYTPLQHKGYRPSHLDVGRARAEAMIAEEAPRASERGSEVAEQSGAEETEVASRSGDEEHQVLTAVSRCMTRPLSARVVSRLQRMIRRVRVYLGVCEELCSSEELVELTLERRRTLNELMDQRTGGLVMNSFRLPFLYITTIRLLLEMYPCAPDGVKWRPVSPIDLRILSGLTCRLELPGSHLLLFMAEYGSCLAKLLLVLPPWQPGSEQSELLFRPRPDALEYLLHLAFVLDIPELFDIICAGPNAPAIMKQSIFDWKGTLEDLEQGERNSTTIDRYIELLKKGLGVVEDPASPNSSN